jgi:hypothetical protein
MNLQQLKREIPKDKIVIKYFFVITNESYVFFVFNKQQEEIYLLNKDEIIFLKIMEKKIFSNYTQYNTKELTHNHQDILFIKPINENDTKLIISNKLFSHKYDSYMYKLFHDIFKYR